MTLFWLQSIIIIVLCVSSSNGSPEFQKGSQNNLTSQSTDGKIHREPQNNRTSQSTDGKTRRGSHATSPSTVMGGLGSSEGSDAENETRKTTTAKHTDTQDCQFPESRCGSVKTLNQIYAALHRIVEAHSGEAKLSVIGETFEGNPIYAMEIHRGVAFYYEIVVVDFGMHSREWASSASALYLIEKLLAEGGRLIENIQWFIIPVANPDGYVYSTSVNNMWKKNRRVINGSKCLGVDIDGNFAVGWDACLSVDPCREEYSGSGPFSEIEARAIRDLVKAIGPHIVDAYVSVHSCVQSIFYPYEYTEVEPPAHLLKDLKDVGNKMASAMYQLRNSTYYVGPNSKFFIGAGVVSDFMFEHFHIPLVFRMVLGDLAYYEMHDLHQCYHPTTATMEALTKECFLGLRALANHLIETRAPYRNVIKTMKTTGGKRMLNATSTSTAHRNWRVSFAPLATVVALQGNSILDSIK